MSSSNFRDAYEFDPETYGGEGCLLGRLVSMMPQVLGNGDTPSAAHESGGAPQTRITVRPWDAYWAPVSDSYNGQGGFSGKQVAAQSERRPYQPLPGNNAAPQPASPIPPQTIQQYGVDQAQQAREAAAARLARGVRNLTRSEPLELDPVDIAKSAGIGLVNGIVDTAGSPADALTGFGYLPAPRWIERLKPDGLRESIEGYTGKFYRPKTRAGRYAETIGEFAPLILGEPAAAVFRGGRAAVGAVRALPSTLVKHAVGPGVAAQTLEDALPTSNLGQTLRKGYPIARRGLPIALAAKRYLSRAIAPN